MMQSIIIGAGIGGLATGVYGQLNGFKTRIFEMHSQPRGQRAACKRAGDPDAHGVSDIQKSLFASEDHVIK